VWDQESGKGKCSALIWIFWATINTLPLKLRGDDGSDRHWHGAMLVNAINEDIGCGAFAGIKANEDANNVAHSANV
jgi:hypothetical protein